LVLVYIVVGRQTDVLQNLVSLARSEHENYVKIKKYTEENFQKRKTTTKKITKILCKNASRSFKVA